MSPLVSWLVVGGMIVTCWTVASLLFGTVWALTGKQSKRRQAEALAERRKAAARKGAITRAHGRALEDHVWSEYMDAEVAKRNRYRASIGLGPLPSRPKNFGRWN